jgi:hypothetical protein
MGDGTMGDGGRANRSSEPVPSARISITKAADVADLTPIR